MESVKHRFQYASRQIHDSTEWDSTPAPSGEGTLLDWVCSEVPDGWRLLGDGEPQDDTDILVGAWGGEDWFNEDTHESKFILFEPRVWNQVISHREDRDSSRGYRHRNGPCWAKYWHPLPSSPEIGNNHD